MRWNQNLQRNFHISCDFYFLQLFGKKFKIVVFSLHISLVFQLQALFTTFSIARYVLQLTPQKNHHFFEYFLYLIHRLILILRFASFGDATTKEAEKSVETIEEIAENLSTNTFYDADRLQLLSLMTRMRSRKLCVENIFFKLNWNIMLTVKLH